MVRQVASMPSRTFSDFWPVVMSVDRHALHPRWIAPLATEKAKIDLFFILGKEGFDPGFYDQNIAID
jgi:hypothetical protein